VIDTANGPRSYYLYSRDPHGNDEASGKRTRDFCIPLDNSSFHFIQNATSCPAGYSLLPFHLIDSRDQAVFVVSFPINIDASDASGTPCPSTGTVEQNLKWCYGNTGTNEGAGCGLRVLTGSALSQLKLPQFAVDAVLANTWHRTEMMRAAAVAFHTGVAEIQNAAIDTAICCQLHNETARSCLQSNREAVAAVSGGHVTSRSLSVPRAASAQCCANRRTTPTRSRRPPLSSPIAASPARRPGVAALAPAPSGAAS
jgi:hypothetical protein